MILLLATGISLFGCGKVQNGQEEIKKHNVEFSAEGIKQVNLESSNETVVLALDFNRYEEDQMEKADGWTNGQMFDCTWRADNVIFENGSMFLQVDQDGENAKPKWSGGEYRTWERFSYGRYEIRMKPIKNNGVVSSFFTYIGPTDNEPWDEIDIEFLGKDTTKVQYNYFTNGVGNHEYVHDLGFDAADAFHDYAFEWRKDSITWYVDGIEVYKATDNIPQTPGKVMMNTWPGVGVDGWLNAFDGTVPLRAEYDWMRITQYDVD